LIKSDGYIEHLRRDSPMHETLNETASRKKEIIKGKIEKQREDLPKPDKRWIQEKIAESLVSHTVAGVDGSSNYIEFLSLVLYALGAECVILGDKKQPPLKVSDIDILLPYRYTNERIRFYMTIFEFKLGLNALENNDIDYILFDGSLFGDLISPVPFGIYLRDEIRIPLLNKYVPKLEKKIEERRIEISSLQFLKELKNEFPEDYTKSMVYLEFIENLVTLKSLLKFKEKIVSISKSSKRGDIFNLNVPDIAVFNTMTKEEGRTAPEYIKITKRVKRNFIFSSSFFRSLEFSFIYSRLETRKNVLKIEFPYRISEEKVQDILSVLKRYCIEGYPYQLTKAHRDVVISRKNMELLVKQYGLFDKTGREMLG
jgi:NurA-like 5'-3' nuclease